MFPVAGLGTRFLPATKAVPKEMLTIVDRPVIQLAVDEAREAGIEHFIFVTGRNKAVIEDHFDKQFELEETLKRRNKTVELEILEALTCPVPDRPALRASRNRSAWVMRCGAHVSLSAKSRLRFCCPTCSSTALPAAWRR